MESQPSKAAQDLVKEKDKITIPSVVVEVSQVLHRTEEAKRIYKPSR